MNKFIQLIDEKISLINEQEPVLGDVDPVAAAGPEPVEEPPAPETPETELPDEEQGQDDPVKMKLDYVEMIRKALIMAPKHIDDVDYARLTKIVDAENIEEMNELVTRIINNNYPHPDFET